MKKLFALVLCLLMLLSAAKAASDYAPVNREDLKVGFVFFGDISDKGYNQAHYQGLLTMQETLGLTDDQIVIRSNIPEGDACDAALHGLIDAGCQIIFGTSYGYMDCMEALAYEYPEIIFSHCSGHRSNGVNFNNYYGAIYQAHYLSGIAAGLKTQTGMIGYVAAMETSQVISGFNAFALGVQSVNSDAVVYVRYIRSCYDPDAERQAAEMLLDAGCDVIAQHCGSPAPQLAAEARGCFGVGCNTDMTADAPEAHLAAPVWKWDAVYTRQVQAVIDGAWMPENIFLDMADGLVSLSYLSKNCAEGTAQALEAAWKKMLSGEFDVFNQALWDHQGNQLTDADGRFLADIPGTSARLGEPITRDFITHEMTFTLQGIEFQE